MCILFSEMLRAERCGRGIIVEEGRIGMQIDAFVVENLHTSDDMVGYNCCGG